MLTVIITGNILSYQNSRYKEILILSGYVDYLHYNHLLKKVMAEIKGSSKGNVMPNENNPSDVVQEDRSKPR